MDVRDRILQAAALVFADAGFRGATTRRIAQEAGVNEVTLFRHFGSKQRLLAAALQAAHTPARTAGLPDPSRHPERELLAWAREQYQVLRERRCLIRTCMAEAGEHPRMARPGNHTGAAAVELRSWLGRLRDAGHASATFDPASATTMFMGTLFADALGRDVMPEMYRSDEDAALREYVTIFLRGLGVGKATRRTRKARSTAKARAR